MGKQETFAGQALEAVPVEKIGAGDRVPVKRGRGKVEILEVERSWQYRGVVNLEFGNGIRIGKRWGALVQRIAREQQPAAPEASSSKAALHAHFDKHSKVAR